MKKVLLAMALFMGTTPSYAAIYYVDYLAGSDSNSGTSNRTPLKRCPGDMNYTPTGSAPTSLLPGDTIIFKGGVKYVGNIRLLYDGSESGGYITYRGNTPMGDWGVGKAIISSTSGATFLTDQSGNTSYIKLLNLEITSSAASGAAGITDNEETTYTKDHIIIQDCYIHDIPDYTDAGCNVNGKGIMFEKANNITIDNNRMERTGYYGIYFRGGNDSLVISNNTMTDQILWGISFIQTNGNVSNVTISNNVLYDLNYVYDTGYSSCGGQYHSDWIYLLSVGQPNDFSNFYIYNNILYNTIDFNEYGGTGMIFIAHQPGDTSVQFNNIRIYNNIIYNPHAQAIQPAGQGTYYIYNNTITIKEGLRALYSYARTNSVPPIIEFRNNIVTKLNGYQAIELGRPSQGNDPPVLTASNNLYNCVSSSPFLYNNIAKTWVQWQAIGYDNIGSLGPFIDPHFIQFGSFPYFASDDLHLRIDSPAKDAGWNASAYLNSDRDSVIRPQGTGWDLGAYEYNESIFLKIPNPPSNLNVQ